MPARPPAPAAEALAERLRTTGRGTDFAAYEQAVCDAFAAFGFVARHIGGTEAPDGVADAPLGTLGYRVMLECKTAGGARVTQPNAVEAAKWREPYHAQYAALIGPAFGGDAALASELQTHGVSAWTSDDLARLLALGADPQELRALCVPGFAEDRIAELEWQRLHGRPKRVAVIAEAL
ncbi:MAG: hypothetical protein ACREQ5_24710 [Candidatus Dormibacteria bacterium]